MASDWSEITCTSKLGGMYQTPPRMTKFNVVGLHGIKLLYSRLLNIPCSIYVGSHATPRPKAVRAHKIIHLFLIAARIKFSRRTSFF